ncbi:hypothetical protein AMTRI_Chr03g145080 [Amborella trichopoda]
MGSKTNSWIKSPLVHSDGFGIKPRNVCFNCFERCHWAQNCPEKLKREKVCKEGFRREDSLVYWKRENGEMVTDLF